MKTNDQNLKSEDQHPKADDQNSKFEDQRHKTETQRPRPIRPETEVQDLNPSSKPEAQDRSPKIEAWPIEFWSGHSNYYIT